MSDWSDQSSGLLTTCLSTFGQSVIYQQGAVQTTITGVLDTGRMLTEFGPGQSSYTVLSVDPKTVPSPPMNGDKVVIGSLTYVVTQVDRDGEGMASLTLTEQ